MVATFSSLFVIFLVALAAPLIASAIPNRPIPEVVFLLFLGALLGPHMAGLIQVTEGVHIVSELGLAFLFLLAGYEINPKELAGNTGKTAAGTWVVCLAIGFGLVALVNREAPSTLHDIALAIALTTTAYGTLAPILKERGLTETPVGKAVTAHGVVGELLPIVAIAVLLSTRASWQAILILVAFFAVACVVALASARARKAGTRVYTAIENLRETNAQTLVRLVVVILLALVALCAAFDLDAVLGGFTAGFVLRFIIPEGDHALEKKLEVVGFGFFIPVFFIVSGAGINLGGVFEDPLSLLLFMGMLVLARTVPVFVSTFVSKDTRGFSVMQRLNVALYSTMALPLIVAVCNIATTGGFMTEATAGTLIMAGALTVLVMPVVTSLTRTVVDAHPVAALQDLASHPGQRDEVLGMYREIRRAARARYRAMRDVRSDPTFDAAFDAEHVLQDFNAERLALLADLRAEELQQVADAASADPASWARAAAARKARWEDVKSRGDAAWERIKELGDREIAEMTDHGDRYLAERIDSANRARDLLRRVSAKLAARDAGKAAVGEAERPADAPQQDNAPVATPQDSGPNDAPRGR